MKERNDFFKSEIISILDKLANENLFRLYMFACGLLKNKANEIKTNK